MFRSAFRFVIAIAVPLLGAAAFAGEIYVDNVVGDDLFDGRAPDPNGGESGPVRTIGRGVSLIRGADRLVLANTGFPYYGSIVLAGQRFSGAPSAPFLVLGNGAVLDGSLPVPPASWVKVGDGLWRFKPWRKGNYQLILDEQPVPEVPCPPNAVKPEKLEVGQWTTFQGGIYLRSEIDIPPKELAYRFAALDVGISLYAVRNARFTDLTLKHFRIDGINAHDQCRGVEFLNCVSTGNGRAGITVAGSSNVVARNCNFSGNRGPSVLVEELGIADVKESVVDDPPVQEGTEPAMPSETEPRP